MYLTTVQYKQTQYAYTDVDSLLANTHTHILFFVIRAVNGYLGVRVPVERRVPVQ